MDKANTPNEIVDVVDENDSVIGQASKGEVNSNPKLIHREVAVLIYDGSRRVLMQQRSRKKKTHPLYWTISVAGHVPAGMAPEEAAHKELIEELGFDTNLMQYEKELFQHPYENFFATSYLGEILKEAVVNFDKDEIENTRFVNEKELDEMIARGEKIEEYSLADFRKFFQGEYNDFI
jgi:isopentenyl-diphosphate Delta-isomerase